MKKFNKQFFRFSILIFIIACLSFPFSALASSDSVTFVKGSDIFIIYPSVGSNLYKTTSGSLASSGSYVLYKNGFSLGTNDPSTSIVTISQVSFTDFTGSGRVYTDDSFSSVLFGSPLLVVPSGVSDLVISDKTDSSLTLSWSAVSGSDGYRIYDASHVKVFDGSGLSFTLTGLSADTSYSYTVISYNAAGESSFISVSGTTAKTVVQPPVNSGGSGSAFNISATSILSDAQDFSKAFENPVLVALGLGVAITVAYAIRNMF